MKKYTRQRLILDIIQNNEVKTQSQLSKILRDHGVDATQATISRDIKELRISKVQTDDYDYRYTVVDTVYDSLNERMEKIFKESVLSVEQYNSIIVVKTIAYTAAVCGQFITNAKIENIGGIVTGLDTIFITPAKIEHIEAVVEDLRDMVK
ncbi:MAG: arginine repressor [Anaerococcus sp.]